MSAAGIEMLRAEGICKSYDGREIIRDVSLRLDQGELVCLLGVSGAGKTTLFHSLSGLEQPEAGRVLLCGEDITGRRERSAICSRRTCCCPTRRWRTMWPCPWCSGREAKSGPGEGPGLLCPVRSGGDGGQVPRPAVRRYAPAGGPAADLSGLPGVVLLDEPFSALDALTKREIHRWYMGMMDQLRLTTLFITHDIDEAILLSDRIYILSGRPGTITTELTVQPPRPRSMDFALSGQFLEYKKQILALLEA